MKPLLPAIVLIVLMGQATAASQMFWVVGNRATNTCDIVTANPLIGGNIYFGSGPYRSLADVKLARSTIRQCPKPAPGQD